MIRVTDDERREMARRLRDRLKTDGIGGFTSGEFGNAVYFSVMHGHRGGYSEAGSFLADLIEPDEPQVKRELKYRSRCDELGAEMKRQRDALLKLADEMESLCGPWSDCGKYYAPLIRKALGE